MRWALALCLLAAAAWIRAGGQAPFEDLRTHAWVGNVLLGAEPDPAAALGRHLTGLAGRFTSAYLLPVLLLLGAGACVWRADQRPLSVPAWPLAPAAVAVLVAAMAWCAHWWPFAGDEFAYLFQARNFSLGAWSTPSPPFREYYDCNNIINNGQWFGMYPPGWPLILSLGDRLGAARLVPPLVGSLALLFVFLIGRRLAGTAAGAITCVLLVASPYFTLNAASYFPHVALAALSAAAVWLLLVAREREGSMLLPCAAGLCLGAAVDVRPPDGALVGVLMLVLHLWLPGRKGQPGLLLVPLFAALMALVLLSANLRATGTLFEGGYALDYGHGLVDPSTGHGVWSAVWNTLFGTSRVLMWQVPLVLELAVLGAIRGGVVERCLVGMLGATVAAYAFYFNLGQVEYGTRYFVSAWTLASVAAGTLLARLAAHRPRFVAAAVAGLVLFTAAGAWPGYWRESESVHSDGSRLDAFVRASAGDRAAVFVRRTPDNLAVYFNRNLPDFSGGPRRLLFLEPERNRRVLATLPVERAFVLDFDPQQRSFALFPFDHAFPEGTDLIVAGINYDLSARDAAAALATWGRVPPESPQYVAAQYNSARLAFRVRRWEDAVRAARAYRSRYPAAGDMASIEAHALAALGRRDEALRVIRSAVPLLPADSPEGARLEELARSLR